MTISYSLDVAKARFCGFTKLLARWKGSIYKILWREFLIFCAAYAFISIIYRCALNDVQKEIFERIVIFVETYTDLIPLSFVLGFYVSLVVGRWWGQYEAIPWPDRVCFLIASYVHGSDERSRMIRRTLGRYLVLIQAITFQAVSTAVKRRFPTTQHLVTAGIMTKEEQSVYEKVSFQYGKWWLPCHWFTALATRAKKEGRIKDSILLQGLLREVLDFRNNCAIMIGYDWISVPLVYTQVVTIATYLYCAALLVGKQYLDASKGYYKFTIDLYVPVFTFLQFFFYVGWLKVAEQILNPYGEDDDDFELNWCLDRTINIVFVIVDDLQMKHPKVKQDPFWDETEIKLPQTRHSAKFMRNPELGSAFRLEVEEAEYISMEELLETDTPENEYKSDSVRRRSVQKQNSSFIRRVISAGFGQSLRRKSKKSPPTRTLSHKEGYSNAAFSMEDENAESQSCRSSIGNSRKSSFKKLVKKVSPSGVTRNSMTFRPSRHKTYDLQEAEKEQIANDVGSEIASKRQVKPASRTLSAPAVSISTECVEREESEDDDFEANPDEHGLDVLMPPIPEEASRANSLASNELIAAAQRGERASQQMDRVHDLVKEASEVLQELSRSVSAQERWKDNEGKGYESCCSSSLSRNSSEESSEEYEETEGCKEEKDEVSVIIEDSSKAVNALEKGVV